ncbi:unnamed protein product [Mycena citricolor]|uniref:Pentatricopeptide repeat-containing protein n=1 Tax=Mycena citricolor TaxID=2018698 RepID=A0AAD2HYQ4_9AGAR|nr:unnamed protein product [Mycena citricolor]
MHYIAPLPNGIIRQFYLAAEDINDVEDARELFSFTHWSQIVETHRYPPPSRTAIPWLTKALLESHSPLAKVMGEDIYALNLPLAPEHRPAIVSGLASQGHAIVARDLWTRYAQAPRDGAAFRGHPTTMLRMVSLLQHLIRREQESMRLAPASAYPPDDDTEPQLIQDFRGILEHVLTSFAAAHEPLETADHRVLTSYTRACFVTGDYVRGINVLKMMLKRREVPDVFDINVLVSAVAEHDPRTAAGLVERMANKGLEPDRITYGTIMHHALSHGDSGLVQQMVKQIRGLRTCFLTYKSIVSLIRGSLSFDTQSPLTQRAKLRGVMNLIKSVGGSTVVNSPHIGKFLVLRALEMDDPVMAYRFWDLLLARSVGWHDREQAYLRGRISNATVAHHKRGWIKDHQRQAMISHLRARTPAVR